MEGTKIYTEIESISEWRVQVGSGEQWTWLCSTDNETFANLLAAAPFLLLALRSAEEAIDFAQAQVESDSDRSFLLKKLRQVRDAIADAGNQEWVQ